MEFDFALAQDIGTRSEQQDSAAVCPFERAQGAQLVHPADRTAAGNCQPDASLTANRLPGGLKKKHASRISGMSAAIVAGVVRLAS